MKKIYILILLSLLSSDAKGKPNILWIVAEDMSPDIGCYGNDLVTTPNIDRLAFNGMRFENVFTTGPACSPSRTALATGVYQTTLGAYHMRYSDELLPELPESITILPKLLRENGYTTGNIKDICGTGIGKDDWLFKTDQKTWDTSSWDKLKQKQPFFGQIHFSESHRAFARSAKARVDMDKIKLPPYYPDHLIAKEDWAGYLEEVNVADEQVGAVLETLERDGLAQNTIVVFFSDHGRPMIRDKNWLYDSGTQVPLVIYYPEQVKKPERFKEGGVSSELISAVDLVAETVLMAGIEVPRWMQARSFLREDSKPRKYVFTAVDRIGNIDSQSRAIRSERYKYIRNYKTPGSVNECSTAYRRAMHPVYHLLNVMGERGLLTPEQEQLLKPIAEEELYDLNSDSYETINLIGDIDHRAAHKELKGELSKWIDRSGDRGFEEDSQALVDYFHEYGVSTTKRNEPRIAQLRKTVEAHFE